MAYFWSRLEISGGRRLICVLETVDNDTATTLHAQTAQCGSYLVHEINFCDVLNADFRPISADAEV